jgi:hypothetical protein
MWEAKKPSDEAEAQQVLDDYVEGLLARGHEGVAKLTGHVTGTTFFGLVKVVEDDGEWVEVVGKSGMLYHILGRAWWYDEEGGDLRVEAKIQEDSGAQGAIYTEFTLAPDGTYSLEY